MRPRRIGRSDLEVSPIGLGCWQFSGGGKGLLSRYWGDVPQPVVDDIVAAALLRGITWFDTAQVYGNGASERALAHGLTAAGRRNGDVVVATKWMPILHTARNLKDSFDERLDALAPFGVDLHQVHQPYALSSVEAQMEAMADLVEQGRIRAVGVSNFDERDMRAAHAALARRGIPLASNQMPFSLLDRRIEDSGVLAAARELGVSIISYSPLAQGLLSGKFHDDPSLVEKRSLPRRLRMRAKLASSRPVVDELTAIARALGATPSQVALAWTTQVHGDAVLAIPGASKAEHVRDNAAALDLALDARALARLDDAARAAAGHRRAVRRRVRA